MLWLTGWTAGCGFLLNELLTNFEWSMLLFATPFFAAWFAVAAMITYMLFGRQKLALARHELRIVKMAIVTLSSRLIPIDEVHRAAADTVVDSNSDGPPTVSGIIRIETLGKPLEFAKGIAQGEARWLAETINMCLDQMAPHRKALSSVEALHNRIEVEDPNQNAPLDDQQLATFDEDLTDDELMSLDDSTIIFQPSRERFVKPSDSRWDLTREGRATLLANRGYWSLASIAGLLFINLFWNGIVGVFILQLVKQFEWFLAIFLVPFEVIGLCMLVGLLFALTAPAWGVSHRIRFGRLERRWWGPLVGRTKSTDFNQLDRIEISSGGVGRSSKAFKFSPQSDDEGDYAITLIDDTNQEIAAIDSLTKGEAYWMADTIMSEHPDMFERDR